MSKPVTFELVVAALSILAPVALAQQPAAMKGAGAKPSPSKLVTTFEVDSPQPVSPEHQPAAAPQVSFSSGQLTIVAQNSTLGDILRAVRQQTGATVDVPSNATERVVAHLGPAPARDVLASLLNGSHFNYVMLGTETDPNALDRLILTAKTSGTPAGGAQAGQAQTAQANPPQPPPNVQPEPEQEIVDELPADESATDQDAIDQQQADADQQQALQQQQQQQQGLLNGQPGQPNVRSPEQLLLELQQRQQQAQQQQLNGQPPTPAAPTGFPVPPGAQPGGGAAATPQ